MNKFEHLYDIILNEAPLSSYLSRSAKALVNPNNYLKLASKALKGAGSAVNALDTSTKTTPHLLGKMAGGIDKLSGGLSAVGRHLGDFGEDGLLLKVPDSLKAGSYLDISYNGAYCRGLIKNVKRGRFGVDEYKVRFKPSKIIPSGVNGLILRDSRIGDSRVVFTRGGRAIDPEYGAVLRKNIKTNRFVLMIYSNQNSNPTKPKQQSKTQPQQQQPKAQKPQGSQSSMLSVGDSVSIISGKSRYTGGINRIINRGADTKGYHIILSRKIPKSGNMTDDATAVLVYIKNSGEVRLYLMNKTGIIGKARKVSARILGNSKSVLTVDI